MILCWQISRREKLVFSLHESHARKGIRREIYTNGSLFLSLKSLVERKLWTGLAITNSIKNSQRLLIFLNHLVEAHEAGWKRKHKEGGINSVSSSRMFAIL